MTISDDAKMMDEVAGDEKQGEIVFPGSDESEKGNGPPSGLNPILKNGPEDGCIAEPTELSKDLSSNNKEVICNALEDKLEVNILIYSLGLTMKLKQLFLGNLFF